MRNWRIIAVLLGALAMSFGTSFAAVKTGEQAPNFTLMDTNGHPQSLADYKGKYVVLEWFNHDCPFVKKHYNSGNMQSLQKEYTDKGVIWLSINSSAEGKQGNYSPAEANKLTMEKDAHPTAVLLDSEGTVGRMYGARTTPHMFVISPEGTLIYQGAIDDSPGVDLSEVETATNYVAQALDQAMSGDPVTDSMTKSYGCSVKY